MTTHDSKLRFCCAQLLGLCLCAAMPIFGQRAGGAGAGGGGLGGNTGGRTTGSATSSTTRQYYNNGTVGDAMISVDPETRRLIVITDEETSRYISQVVTNLDRARPQVLIKVVFLEVTYRDGSDIGVEAGFRKNINNPTSVTASNLFGLAQQGIGPTTGVTTLPGAGIYQILGHDFQATLRAIAEAGKLEVLSRPSILARNNQAATITVGQQVPLISNVRFDTLGNQINTLLYRDVGIILKVTPFITSDGMVEMIISPQISALSNQTIPISSGPSGVVGAPIIDLRSADTVVVTPDGQTVIIGGLMQNQKTQTTSKIPVLGDIPGLGVLFRHKVKANTKTELMIFLTPHIVLEPSRLAAVSSEKGGSELVPKAFSEQELNQFLEKVPMRENRSPDEPPPATKNVKPKSKYE